jgi:nicotinate-nucleotide--dimethylbenzimidazole phosphoribosyltransferase
MCRWDAERIGKVKQDHQTPNLPEWITAPCPAVSQPHREAALARQTQLTKPAGALGRLEHVAVDLAAIQHAASPVADRAPVLIFAGDHGIAELGVSAYPQDVTIAMVSNFAGGGAAISVLARELGCRLEVIDVGTCAKDALPGVVTDKPRAGTRNFAVEPALTKDEVIFAMSTGRRAVMRALADRPDVLILGEMGIANTTSAAAIAAALLGADAASLTGAGTGLDVAAQKRKSDVIESALALHGLRRQPAAPLDVLSAVGGLEIAALVGALIAAGQQRIAVLVDGFIVSVAALVATGLNASCRPYLMFTHRSAEQGHHRVLQSLDAAPLLDLDLRLGEGSGAALALPLVRMACALHTGMATFAEAAVPGRKSDAP